MISATKLLGLFEGKYYVTFYVPAKKGWYFLMPEEDGPPEAAGCGDIAIGPYITREKAQEDIDKVGGEDA